METYNPIKPVKVSMGDLLRELYWVHRFEVHMSAALFVAGSAFTACALAII
ncbi:hypothetical protein [Ancylobacter sp.]|uniref:hypothetical protein n=1 Tax=Ancylobacter sp. TaxID=1872567 RepID=UPI003C7E8F16